MKTKESLGIYWNFKNGQEEVDGIIFFGLWEKNLPDTVSLKEFINLWKEGEVDCKLVKYENESYSAYSIEVYIKAFPEPNNWFNIIKECLSWLVKNGSKIAWCGGEDCSPNPGIFNPNNSFGNIYACYLPELGFFCNAGLEEEFRYINNQQLTIINKLI